MIQVVQRSSWIRIPDPDFLPIPDPGVKKALVEKETKGEFFFMKSI